MNAAVIGSPGFVSHRGEGRVVRRGRPDVASTQEEGASPGHRVPKMF